MAFLRRPIRSINSSSLERPSSSNRVGWSAPRRCQSCSGRMDRRFPTNFFDREAAKAPSDEFALNLDARELPLIRADTYLNDLLLKYCEAALADRRSDTSELRTRVENAISTMLPHGRVLVEDVARSLRMSERTLARKLSDEGLNFTDVLQQVRRDLAVRYLDDRKLHVSKIAWLLGFQEVSAFTHAFKRWTGKTPRELRTSGAY